MAAAPTFVLFLSLFVQQDSPAEFLKKVEKRYADAKTIKVNLEARRVGTAAGGEIDETWMGKFVSKGETMVFLEVWGSRSRTKWITDGSTMALYVDKRQPQKKAHKMSLGPWGRKAFIRAGMFSFIHSLEKTVYKSKDAVNFEGLFKTKNPADAGVEKAGGVECRVVEGLYVPPEGEPMKCKLWIDPKTLVVMKRETVKKGSSESWTLTESFGQAEFDGEISDDQFKIP